MERKLLVIKTHSAVQMLYPKSENATRSPLSIRKVEYATGQDLNRSTPAALGCMTARSFIARGPGV
jgi:hypothetical protein